MRAILTSVLAVILLVPANSQAKEIFFEIGPDLMLSASFGLEPFNVSRFCDTRFSSDSIVLDSCSFQLVSGPLLNLTEDATINRTVYSYGPGTVSMTISAETPQGKLLEGSFVGTTWPFELFVCEGCDEIFGGGLADDPLEIALMGSIDVGFATIVGASSPFVTGSFAVGLEAIDGDPTSTLRKGFSDSGNGFLDLTIQETIPEPSLLLLGLASAGVLTARRRRLRAGTHA